VDRIKRTEEGRKVIYVTLTANIFLALLKITLGYLAASAALVADGFHSFSDIVTTLGVLMAVVISNQPPDEEHHYGHGQAEHLAATGLGLILLLTAFFLGRDMVLRIAGGDLTFPGRLALVGIALSIAVKEILYHYVRRAGEKIDSSALRADAWHHRSDAFSSLAAGLGIIGARLGFSLLDPLAGLVVSLLILRVAYQMLRQELVRLLGRGPDPEKIENIRAVIKEVEGVVDINEIKGLYHGPELYLDVKITVPSHISVAAGHDIAVKVREEVQGVYDEAQQVLIHVDPAENQSEEAGENG